jgi:phage terminase small subunit
MATATGALSAKRETFCQHYLVSLDAARAAREAGYSARSAKQQGHELLKDEAVAARIQELKAERAAELKIDAAAVLRRFWLIATADPNDLIQYRRTCCRFCYGDGHQYQRTPAELRRARAAWEAKQTKTSKDVFDEEGGDGYDRRKPPHPDCPECFGDGEEHVFVADTRQLTEQARMLYAGVKQTKEGLEVKMHSQQEALVSVARHLGMFGDRVESPETAEEKASRIRAALEAMDETTTGAEP